MKRTCDLQVLDEYTKALSKKQIQMLYEAKVDRKYSNRLFESTIMDQEEDEVVYEMYVDDYTISELELTQEDVVESVRTNAEKFVNVEYRENGICFKTADPDTYETIIDTMELLGIDPDVLSEMIDEKYLKN